MVERRVNGTCCLLIPLKFGVGMIAMYQFSMGMSCLLALFLEDIRMQPNGYDTSLYYLPATVGAFGVIFGFVGLLGVYDDKVNWIRSFNFYLLAALSAKAIAFAADYLVLRQCDTWLKNPHAESLNPQLYALASQDVCSYARYSYVLGFSMDFAVNLYFTYCALEYYKQVVENRHYAIDFGDERYNAVARWKRFQVKEPEEPEKEEDEENVSLTNKAEIQSDYGAVDDDPANADPTGKSRPKNRKGTYVF